MPFLQQRPLGFGVSDLLVQLVTLPVQVFPLLLQHLLFFLPDPVDGLQTHRLQLVLRAVFSQQRAVQLVQVVHGVALAVSVGDGVGHQAPAAQQPCSGLQVAVFHGAVARLAFAHGLDGGDLEIRQQTAPAPHQRLTVPVGPAGCLAPGGPVQLGGRLPGAHLTGVIGGLVQQGGDAAGHQVQLLHLLRREQRLPCDHGQIGLAVLPGKGLQADVPVGKLLQQVGAGHIRGKGFLVEVVVGSHDKLQLFGDQVVEQAVVLHGDVGGGHEPLKAVDDDDDVVLALADALAGLLKHRGGVSAVPSPGHDPPIDSAVL